jgi:hypothetical protein
MKPGVVWALALMLGLVAPGAWAEGKQYKFDLDVEGYVGGKKLRSATYRVEIQCDEQGKGTVSFYEGSRRAAQAPCRLVDQSEASDAYAVGYSRDASGKKVVSSIYLKGAKEKVVLEGGN